MMAQINQPRFFQYVVIIDLGMATQLGGIMTLFFMPCVFLVSYFVDKLRVNYETQKVRKLCYFIFTTLTIIMFLPVAINPCNTWVTFSLVEALTG